MLVGLGWDDTNPSARTSTSLSPSQPQSPTTYSVQQWMNHFASQEQASWQHQPGPPPSAPAPNNVPASSYNPNTYGLMPGGQQPPRSGWSANSSPGFPPDTRSWGVHYNRQHDHGYREDQSPKPPLPVCNQSTVNIRESMLTSCVVAKASRLVPEFSTFAPTLLFF